MRHHFWKWISATGGVLLLVLCLSLGSTPAQAPTTKTGKKLPRPYPGAPPLVPHDVEERKGLCQSCHGTGDGGAPITPHPNRTHFCIQCHIGQDLSAKPFVAERKKQ
jgi:nitrate reductase cytochrome c-type subunit